jgi:hypothetical protein
MDSLKQLQSLGLTLPSPLYIFGLILFGLLGFAVYRIGKVRERTTTKWLGVAMMFYPYATPSTWLLYTVGIGLCVAAYLTRDND